MKLEDQILSIEQIRELQELGFDVRKHASLYFVEEKYFVKENFIVLPEQIDITRVPEDVKITPTMSIGDIIDVLPKSISNELYFLCALQVHPRDKNKYYSAYKFDYDHTCLISFEDENPLFSLFELLKWCIKQKHIKI